MDIASEVEKLTKGGYNKDAARAKVAHDIVLAAIRIHVRRVYDKYGQNLSKAAEALKVARNTAKKYL